MNPCFAVQFETPKRVGLRGLWFGPQDASRVLIWVHGLGSSLFSKIAIYELLQDGNTAVFAFNNRGHDQVSYVSKHGTTKNTRIKAGAAHEVFTDCVDDIDGAITFVKSRGVKKIFLVGHSTGCQKSVYWHAKRKKDVKALILLAPISDWSAEMKLRGPKIIERAQKAAMKLIAANKPHTLLPEYLWHEQLDAQRFLSLYSPNSTEEIFSYGQPKKQPRIMKLISAPVLVLLAENDEFADRPATEMAEWFKKYLPAKSEVEIIRGATHGFSEAEERVTKEIKRFIER